MLIDICIHIATSLVDNTIQNFVEPPSQYLMLKSSPLQKNRFRQIAKANVEINQETVHKST